MFPVGPIFPPKVAAFVRGLMWIYAFFANLTWACFATVVVINWFLREFVWQMPLGRAYFLWVVGTAFAMSGLHGMLRSRPPVLRVDGRVYIEVVSERQKKPDEHAGHN